MPCAHTDPHRGEFLDFELALTDVNGLDRKKDQIPVTWTRASPLRSLTPPEVYVAAVEDAARLEVLTLAGERKGT